MFKTLTLALLLLGFTNLSGCSGPEQPQSPESAQVAPEDEPQEGQMRAKPLILSTTGIGVVSFCDSLHVVGRNFRTVADTSFILDGKTLPAKIARLDDQGWVLFESSATDTALVWRISSNSPLVKTPNWGFTVSTTIQQIISAGEQIEVEESEGQLTIALLTEGVGGILDAGAAATVHERQFVPGPQPLSSATDLLPSDGYLTVLIELVWSKRRVLEVYLNVAEFGTGVYGVGAASERFFAREPARVDRQQAALLAAVLPSPKRLLVARPSPYVRSRQEWILAQMEQLGGVGLLEGLR